MSTYRLSDGKSSLSNKLDCDSLQIELTISLNYSASIDPFSRFNSPENQIEISTGKLLQPFPFPFFSIYFVFVAVILFFTRGPMACGKEFVREPLDNGDCLIRATCVVS
jgi:hypothetical protein